MPPFRKKPQGRTMSKGNRLLMDVLIEAITQHSLFPVAVMEILERMAEEAEAGLAGISCSNNLIFFSDDKEVPIKITICVGEETGDYSVAEDVVENAPIN